MEWKHSSNCTLRLARIPSHLTSFQLREFITEHSADSGLLETMICTRYALMGYLDESACKMASRRLDGKSIEGCDIRAKFKPSFDTTTSIKITQLSNTVEIGKIQQVCSQFGTVKSLILKNKYAYVKFNDFKSASKAIQLLNNPTVTIDGMPVSAKLRKRPVYKAINESIGDSTHISDHDPLFLPVTIKLSSVELSPIKLPCIKSTSHLCNTTPSVIRSDSSMNSLDEQYSNYQTIVLSPPPSDPAAIEPPSSSLSPTSMLISSPNVTSSNVIQVQLEAQPPSEPSSLTNDHLYHYFRQFGPIDEKPVIQPDTNYAYVTYSSNSDATKACENSSVMLKNVKLTVKLFVDKPIPEMDTQTFLSNSKDPLLDRILLRACNSSQCYSDVSLFPLASEGSVGVQVTGSKEHVSKVLLLLDMEANYHLSKLITKQSVQYDYNKIPQLSNQKFFDNLQKDHCVQFLVTKQDESQVDMASSFCVMLAQCLQQLTPVTKYELSKKFTEEKLQCGQYVFSWSFEDNCGNYVEMDGSIARAVEGGYQVYLVNVQAHSLGGVGAAYSTHCYQYDFLSMTQTNLMTGRIRKIARSANYTLTLECRGLAEDITAAMKMLQAELDKPSVTSIELIEPEDQKDIVEMANRFCVEVKQEKQGELTLLGEKDYLGKVRMELMTASVSAAKHRRGQDTNGPNWEPQKQDVELKNVSRLSKEWEDIEKHFKATLPQTTLLQIQRIQNKWLWKKYVFSRKRMAEKNGDLGCNEMMLFHGTRQTPPSMIYNSEYGFDFRFSSTNGLYGKGAYFAYDSRYSQSYSYKQIGNPFCGNQSQMFLAYVLTGDSVTLCPDRTLDKPPIKNYCTKEYYDTVNGISGNSKIYIVYDHDKSYPAYLITYI